MHEGPRPSFWYGSLSAPLSEVPVRERKLVMTHHARTADFQDVTVQATVTSGSAAGQLGVTGWSHK